MNYYYLVASLPQLRMGDPAPMSVESFRALCREHLSPADFSALESVLDETGEIPCEHPFAVAWRNAGRQIRNAVARQRGARLRRDASPYIRPHDGFDVWVETSVAEAFQRPDPLERQRAIERVAWDLAGELAAGEPFGSAVVLAYGLRLRQVERWAAMDGTAGMAVVNERTETRLAAS